MKRFLALCLAVVILMIGYQYPAKTEENTVQVLLTYPWHSSVKTDNITMLREEESEVTIIESEYSGNDIITIKVQPIVQERPYALFYEATSLDGNMIGSDFLSGSGEEMSFSFLPADKTTDVYISLDSVETQTYEVQILLYLYNTSENESFLYGDVNGDGVMDGRDLLRLAKFLAGQDVKIDEKAADMNGDGKVDGRDVLRLAKKLAGS